MNISHVNGLLDRVKVKLESLDPARLEEEHKKPSEHSAPRMSAAKKRLGQLYSKLTANRTDATKVHAYGTKRGRK